MASNHEFQEQQTRYNNAAQASDLPSSTEAAIKSLDEISNTLNQMLMLAELSASNANVDRERLQKVLEHLKNKIDRLADCIGEA